MAFRLRRSKLFLSAVHVLRQSTNTQWMEDRFIAVGRIAGRPVFVAFTIRVKDRRRFVRPISARFMHAKAVAAYEEESATTENG
jgi:hypothetical protein